MHNILLIREKLKQEHQKFEEMDWDEKIGDTFVVPIFTPVPYSFPDDCENTLPLSQTQVCP